jgi:exopolyphosphatase / guanosine-5'-triphosphate,3'-diphosphate pyrophosphatase
MTRFGAFNPARNQGFGSFPGGGVPGPGCFRRSPPVARMAGKGLRKTARGGWSLTELPSIAPTDPRRTRRSSSADETLAAIDLGTNNCRLLVARPNGAGFRVIDAYSRIVRLGEGLSRTGLLSEAAMDRTIAALRVCARKMQQRRVTRARSVATEACRRAANCEAFLERVRAETGIDIEIITSEVEAELAFRGCAPLLTPDRNRAIVFDIGGGSTEIGWLAVDAAGQIDLIDCVSLPIGVVNLAERHDRSPVDPALYETMTGEVASMLAEFGARNDIATAVAGGTVQMLGTSGTVTTLTGIHLRLSRYDRSQVDGRYLEFEAIDAINRELAALDWHGRAATPCVGPERADLVVAGCIILSAICRLWPVGRLRVADRGLREGILFELAGSLQ